MTHVHCPECGFQNQEAANYCSKCGALLIKDEPAGSTTVTYTPEEVVDEEGGRSRTCGSREPHSSSVPAEGERRDVSARGDRVEIGRSPESDVFLDDVTVSSSHALLVKDEAGYTIEDGGSLNGTYVNRRRVERPGSKTETRSRSASTG